MKKIISLLLTAILCAASVVTAMGATFDIDSGIPPKAPFISRGNTAHPDTTKVFDLNTKSLGDFVSNGDSKYAHTKTPNTNWVEGSSGEPGDYAPRFEAATNDAFVNNSTATTGDQLYLIYDVELMNTIRDWQGDQIVEFDVKTDNTNGRLSFMMWYLWADSSYTILNEDGKVHGTDYSYPIGEWFHLKMVFNNHVWNVYATDSEGEHHIVQDVNAVGKNKPGNTWSQGSRMAFLFSQPSAVESEEDRMAFALDNVHIYRLYPDDGSNDISNYYLTSYEEADGTSAAEFPADGKLLLDFGAVADESLFDTENLVLEDMDGNEIAYTGTYADSVYTIDPSIDLIQAEEYKLKVSDEVRKMLNADAPPTGSALFTIRDDRPLIISDFTGMAAPEAGAEFGCEVTIANRGSEAENVGIVICIYDETGALRSIKRENFDVASGETTENVSLIVPDDYDVTYDIKLFLTKGSGIRILDEENIS